MARTRGKFFDSAVAARDRNDVNVSLLLCIFFGRMWVCLYFL